MLTSLGASETVASGGGGVPPQQDLQIPWQPQLNQPNFRHHLLEGLKAAGELPRIELQVN